MITLLSPAKSLNYDKVDAPRTQPRFKDDTMELVSIMKKKKAGDLRKLMSISEKLADLNVQRFQDFEKSHNVKNSKQAMFAFTGDVYQGLEADTFSEEEIQFAQDHVRMLSGLYGLLRPLDVMQPYRLEMGTKLKTQKGKNLYEFWGSSIASMITKDLKKVKSKVIINLASQEYFKAVDTDALDADIYDIHFREYRGDELKFISFNAKKARGFMTQYIVKKRVSQPEDLKAFDLEGYTFAPDLSTEKSLFFIR